MSPRTLTLVLLYAPLPSCASMAFGMALGNSFELASTASANEFTTPLGHAHAIEHYEPVRARPGSGEFTALVSAGVPRNPIKTGPACRCTCAVQVPNDSVNTRDLLHQLDPWTICSAVKRLRSRFGDTTECCRRKPDDHTRFP